MRIVAGTWRGRRIEEPRGREVTRPTTDRVREACASVLDSALDEGIGGARVLDAFAGSGALGIEMLSRGALHATFFDIDRQAALLVRRNLEGLKAERSSYRVVTGDVLAAASRGRVPGGPFDAVLIDPPYALGPEPAEALLEALAAHDLERATTCSPRAPSPCSSTDQIFLGRTRRASRSCERSAMAPPRSMSSSLKRRCLGETK